MNLEALLNGTKNIITINDFFLIPKELYEKNEILDLSKIKVEGKITYPKDDNLLLEASCKGIMTIEDSVSLKPVCYHFSFEINENIIEKLENDKFTLDILSILWENIVLEIPIRYSEVTDYKKYFGDGWKVISEEEYNKNTNNPFKELLKEIEKE